MKEIRAILDCGCLIYTDGSYKPCKFHNQIGHFTEEESNLLCLELAGQVLGDLFSPEEPNERSNHDKGR